MTAAAAVPEIARPTVKVPSAKLMVPPPDLSGLLAALASAQELVDRARSRAVALALNAAGEIELPDFEPATPDDQALIRAVAPLYLAAQLEEASLLPVVEALCGLAVSGGLPIARGPSADLIQAFWRGRNERFSGSERRAYFARLFGADDSERGMQANAVFEDLMINLTEALYKADETAAGGTSIPLRTQARIANAARNLAHNVLEKAGRMTQFMSEEILATVQSAVQILQQPDVQRAAGGRSLWTAVRAAAGRYLQETPDTGTYVARGKSGLIVLSWLADSLPHFDEQRPWIALDHPVIESAAQWLQASLAIREAGARAGA